MTWIPCSERLPEDLVEVLTRFKKKRRPAVYRVGWLATIGGKRDWVIMGGRTGGAELTHWMDIPPLEEGEK